MATTIRNEKLFCQKLNITQDFLFLNAIENSDESKQELFSLSKQLMLKILA